MSDNFYDGSIPKARPKPQEPDQNNPAELLAWIERNHPEVINAAGYRKGIGAINAIPKIEPGPHGERLLVEKIARSLAEQFSDGYDNAFVDKREWEEMRGVKSGRFRDINEPMQIDYDDAAGEIASLLALQFPELARNVDFYSGIVKKDPEVGK